MTETENPPVLTEACAQSEVAIHWVRAGARAELFADGPCHGATLHGRKIGIFDVDGNVYALDDVCTHGNALLSDGEIDGHEIECPLHAGAFDVRDGRALCSPVTRGARCYAVKVEAGNVFVAMVGDDA